MIITGKDNIRERVLLSGLKLEAKHGMKVSTGRRSCYAIVKDEFNLKGNKIKVYTQFKELLSKNE